MILDFKRAKEIVDSPSIIEVLHDETPIWIRGLNSEKETAEVKEKGEVKEVKVSELIEGNRIM